MLTGGRDSHLRCLDLLGRSSPCHCGRTSHFGRNSHQFDEDSLWQLQGAPLSSGASESWFFAFGSALWPHSLQRCWLTCFGYTLCSQHPMAWHMCPTKFRALEISNGELWAPFQPQGIPLWTVICHCRDSNAWQLLSPNTTTNNINSLTNISNISSTFPTRKKWMERTKGK